MTSPLSIDDARAAVLANARPLGDEDVPLDAALGRVLAAEVVAAYDVPGFDNSAMDGFAAAAGPARLLRLVGESRAGAPFAGTLAAGEAARISTGAALPAGADAVVQLERAEERDGHVELLEDAQPGRNIRRAGEDVRAGAVVLPAGTLLGAAELGAAVNAGVASLLCARRPRVAVLATGDELVAPGVPLGPGQVHDSNLTTLVALARAAGAEVVIARHVTDDEDATRAALTDALDGADVVVVSGGVSVGPHDHVKPALAALGVEEVFWRVALRPGRPTWFGVKRPDAMVFGLPGNPVSSYVTFVLFVRPALAALQGADPRVPRSSAPLAVAVARHRDRDECIRVRLDDEGRAHPTGPQGSHVLTSLVGADALAIVPRGEGELAAGADVALEPLG